MNHKWARLKWCFPFGLLTLLGLLGLIWVEPLHAEEPGVVFNTDRLELSGTPGATLRFPIDLQAGPNGIQAVSLSIEALTNQDDPNQTILSDRLSFLPASFDMAQNGQRRVWGTINVLPSVPGIYSGKLVASYGISPTLQSEIEVELNVKFVQVQIASPGRDELKMQGRSGDLTAVIWLEAVDGPATGIILAADELVQINGSEAIQPDQLALSPASINLNQGEAAMVTIKVTGGVSPGTYQGQIRFRQANQSLNEVEPVDLTVEVLPTPTLNLPQGDSVTTELVRCGNRFDCLLVEYLLPSDYRQEGPLLQVENPSQNRVNITHIQPTIARIGVVNVAGAVDLFEAASLPLTVEPRSSMDILLRVPTAGINPGQYKGNVTLYLSDEIGRTDPDQNRVIAVELNIRNGPLLAIFLIVLGILAGRFLQKLSGEQTRLLGLHYRLRGRMRPYEAELAEADKKRVEADALALRRRIYDQDLEKVEEKLQALSQRPQRLVSLNEALPAIREACQQYDLNEADCQLLKECGERLRAEIHADKEIDVVAEMKAIAARAEPLQRLGKLADDLATKPGLEEVEKTRLAEILVDARTALGQGDEQAAQTSYENVQRALELLPEIRAVQNQAETQFRDQETRLAVIGLELNMARQAVFELDFDQAHRWLERARLTLAGWQEPPSDTGQKMAGGKMPWEVVGDELVETIDRLAARIASWQPLAFLGDRGRVSVELFPPRLGEGFWESLAARWQGFATAAWPEISLWLGTPVIWLITMVLTALIGFQALYVAQGATFGANPLNDYLPLVLWGLTSDVTGATISKLADLRKAT